MPPRTKKDKPESGEAVDKAPEATDSPDGDGAVAVAEDAETPAVHDSPLRDEIAAKQEKTVETEKEDRQDQGPPSDDAPQSGRPTVAPKPPIDLPRRAPVNPPTGPAAKEEAGDSTSVPPGKPDPRPAPQPLPDKPVDTPATRPGGKSSPSAPSPTPETSSSLHSVPRRPATLPGQSGQPRVLVVHSATSTTRLIRETLENFTTARIDTSPDTVHGYEMALARRYQLFIFALHLPDMEGTLLYEMISKTYAAYREGEARVAPGVIFIREADEAPPGDEISRDARVKGILGKPLSIGRLLEGVKNTLPLREPMMGG